MKLFESWDDIPDNFTGIFKFTFDDAIRFYKNGRLHREDGPAIIYSSGSKFWYLNGLRHRESGPAVTIYSGDNYWYFKDKTYSTHNEITNESWLIFVKQIKREEVLKIFI